MVRSLALATVLTRASPTPMHRPSVQMYSVVPSICNTPKQPTNSAQAERTIDAYTKESRVVFEAKEQRLE